MTKRTDTSTEGHNQTGDHDKREAQVSETSQKNPECVCASRIPPAHPAASHMYAPHKTASHHPTQQYLRSKENQAEAHELRTQTKSQERDSMVGGGKDQSPEQNPKREKGQEKQGIERATQNGAAQRSTCHKCDDCSQSVDAGKG